MSGDSVAGGSVSRENMARDRVTPGAEVVARWDLDKTYLRSDFSTLADLLQNAIERPDQKRPVPGATELLRELSLIPSRIHVLSGSPEQLRRVITERLRMDGVRVDELTLKPNLRNLLRLRFSELKDQLGYKLSSLLDTRAIELEVFGANFPREVLFGDDSEADAFVYSLYADIARGRVDEEELARVLDAGETPKDVRERIFGGFSRIRAFPAAHDPLIVIHLDRQTPPSHFSRFGSRLVPFFNYAQAAMVLTDRGLLGAGATHRVCQALTAQHRFDLEALVRSYWDLERRGHVRPETVSLLAEGGSPSCPETERLAECIQNERPASPGPFRAAGGAPSSTTLSYVELAREHRGGQNRTRSPWQPS